MEYKIKAMAIDNCLLLSTSENLRELSVWCAFAQSTLND